MTDTEIESIGKENSTKRTDSPATTGRSPMPMCTLKFAAIALVLTAAAACTQSPESGNNKQATDIEDASNATTPPPADNGATETYSGNNKTFDDASSTANTTTPPPDNGTTPQ